MTRKSSQTIEIAELLLNFQKENNGNFQKLNDRLDLIAESIKKDIRQEFEPKFDKIKEEQQTLQELIARQLVFTEQLDNAQRANNIIITGLPEDDPLEYKGQTATNDEDKSRWCRW